MSRPLTKKVVQEQINEIKNLNSKNPNLTILDLKNRSHAADTNEVNNIIHNYLHVYVVDSYYSDPESRAGLYQTAKNNNWDITKLSNLWKLSRNNVNRRLEQAGINIKNRTIIPYKNIGKDYLEQLHYTVSIKNMAIIFNTYENNIMEECEKYGLSCRIVPKTSNQYNGHYELLPQLRSHTCENNYLTKVFTTEPEYAMFLIHKDEYINNTKELSKKLATDVTNKNPEISFDEYEQTDEYKNYMSQFVPVIDEQKPTADVVLSLLPKTRVSKLTAVNMIFDKFNTDELDMIFSGINSGFHPVQIANGMNRKENVDDIIELINTYHYGSNDYRRKMKLTKELISSIHKINPNVTDEQIADFLNVKRYWFNNVLRME